MAERNKKFIIIDGNALLHRAWHALPPLTTKDGTLVNAVYGFTSILLNIIKEFHPEYGAVAFDPPGGTFRHESYKEYKATREKQPDELYAQIPLVKEVARAFGFRIEEHAGFEADDVLGTLTHQAADHDGIKTIIVTGDMDALQLVDDKTVVFTLKKGINDTVTYDIAAVKERYGFGPEKVVEYKALAGDSSDNIPGVAGVGEKTAKELLSKFDSIDEIYKYLEKGGGDKIKDTLAKKLLSNKKEAFMSKELATIRKDIDLKFSPGEFAVKPAEKEELFEIFRKLEFRSLLTRAQTVLGSLPVSEGESPKPFGGKQGNLFSGKITPQSDFKMRHGYHLIDTLGKAEALEKELSKVTELAIDTETDSLGGLTSKMIGLSLCAKAGEAYYVTTDVAKPLASILVDKDIKKYGHNIKYDLEVLHRAGFEVNNIDFDTKVAAYLIHPTGRSHSLDNLAFVELKHEMVPIESLIGSRGKKQISLVDVPLSQVADYSAEDADYTFRLVGRLDAELKKEHLYKLFTEIEMPLLPVLVRMEEAGVKIDSKFLQKMSAKVGKDIVALESKIHKLAKTKFNVNSPLQLKEVLFEKLKLSTEGVGKTKTGFSTAADELEKLVDKHPIIKLIMEHRELSKLKNTYLDALPELVNSETGRVHTSFNQTVTSTGRLSSSDPNLQNIPIRSPLGGEIRKAFIAEPGFELISADYSQIELRVAADLSGDKKLIEIFKAGKDIHTSTAAFFNQIPGSNGTPEIRRTAKEVNFGVLYGMGPHGLAQRTGMDYARAKGFIDRYFSAFTGLAKYLEEVKDMARTLGYVETKYGRRLQLPDIHSGVQQIRAGAERLATNMPIQGTAADIIKMAMIEIDKGLSKISPKSRMLMQVHDELVFEAPKDDVAKVSKFVEQSMESVAKLKVPVNADVHSGANWQEAH
ncbi:MAG: DNA polymerase I [Candidatus Komeilibacteria bacterium]|nr:DNA polymerase I [Candidatus Komeilibacteria bacterium]